MPSRETELMGSPSLFPKGKGPYEVKSSSFTGGPYWFPGDHIISWPFMLSRGSGSLAELPCGSFVGRNTQVGEVFGKSGNAPHINRHLTSRKTAASWGRGPQRRGCLAPGALRGRWRPSFQARPCDSAALGACFFLSRHWLPHGFSP